MMELFDFTLASVLPPLKDQIKANPAAFISGCVAFIPVSIWVISMINWMIMGEVDGIFGSLAICVALILGGFAASPPRPELAPIFLAALLVMICLWPVIRASADARIEHVSKLDEVDRAYERLSMGRRDPGAIFKLAAACYDLGMKGPAIAMAEEVLPQLDKKFFGEQHAMYESWRRERPVHGMFNPTVCPDCGEENGPGLPFCPRCGEPQYLTIAENGWRPNSLTARVIGAWVSGISVLVLIPVIGAAAWPLPLKLSLIVLLVLVAGFSLTKAFFKVARDVR